MGRAIVRNPQAFLMDEPLSNLDAKLRVQTRTEIAALQRRLGITTVYVTHDQVEAMTMGDRVCVLKDGYLMQVDTPRNLYDRPDNVFVAGFIGSPAMNLIDVDLDREGAVLGGRVVPAAARDDGGAGRRTARRRRPSVSGRRGSGWSARAKASPSRSSWSRSWAPTPTPTARMHTSRAARATSSDHAARRCPEAAHEGRDHPPPDQPGGGARVLGRDRPPGLRRRRPGPGGARPGGLPAPPSA